MGFYALCEVKIFNFGNLARRVKHFPLEARFLKI